MSSCSSSEDSIDIETVENSKSETSIDVTLKSSKSTDISIDHSLVTPRIDFDAIGEFCFESDILALKGNNDYKMVLEAIVILEAQREQAIKDLDSLLELKDEALTDPLQFVERLKNNENLNMPSAQKIHPVPCIDWGKYALSGDPAAFRRRQMSRIVADVRKNFKRKLNVLVENESESDFWSQEEEKYLEVLLKRFSFEKNLQIRWEKIAECFEKHNVAQIANKALKSFPNLIENSNQLLEKKSYSYSQKKELNGKTCESSLPNAIGENSSPDLLNADEDSLDFKLDNSDDEINADLYDTSEYQELLLYKRLLRKRIKLSTMTQHFGFKCSNCNTEPILGVRYHCIDCTDISTNFCNDCVKNSQDVAQHTSDHTLEEIHHSNAGFLDRDYMHFLGNDYNYLDPNYMPAA